MKGKSGKGTLQRKLIIRLLLAFCLPLLLVTSYIVMSLSRMLRNNAINAAETMVNAVSREFAYFTENSADEISQLAMDPNIIAALSGRKRTDAETVHLVLDQLKPFSKRTMINNSAVRSMRILYREGQLYPVAEWLIPMSSEAEMVDLLTDRDDRSVVTSVTFRENGMPWSLPGEKNVWSIDRVILGENGIVGVAEVILDHASIWNHTIQMMDDSRLEVMLYSGEKLISYTGEKWLDEAGDAAMGVTTTRNCTILTAPLATLGLTVRCVIPSSVTSLSTQHVLLLILAFLLVIGISYLLVRAVCQRQLLELNMLVERMDTISGFSNSEAAVDLQEDEVRRMSRHFEKMYTRLNETHKREQQLLYDDLTNELRPHFICNVMDQLRLQAERYEQTDLSESIIGISRYFRYAMLGKQDLVPMADELENAVNYLKLVNAMREDPFRYEISMDSWVEEHIAETTLPRQLFQPLLENAVRHGIGKETGGYVHLSIFRQDGQLIFDVEDNGPGMEAKQMERLNTMLEQPNEADNGHHLGLINVKRRLDLVYPDRNRMTITSGFLEGTRVRIVLDEDNRTTGVES